MERMSSIMREVKDKNRGLFEKDFLLTWDKSTDDLQAVLALAELLKLAHRENVSLKCFESGLAVSIFRDNSTRTRFSYTSAANLLGLQVQDLDEGKSQIAHGETVRETANMISFLSEVIGIRDDMYLGAGHTYMKEVGEALDDGFTNGVLPCRPAIVNLQCDVDHPTQAMADLAWLKEYYGSLDSLKGKTIAMTWAYSPSYGKPLSVPQGIIGLMTRFGMNVRLAYPEGYNLIPDVEKLAAKQAAQSGGSFAVTHSMDEAFDQADIVYPKSWAPFSVMGERTTLLKNNDHPGLKELEKQALARNAGHKDWACTEARMSKTKDGEALYMHCLPADISGVSCREGEVDASVFERYRIRTYREAGWKPFIIAAMIMSSRFQHPGELVDRMIKRGTARQF
ncbi:MAG TPA: knotted carbamoyltransferase YgeW [Kiritimatiellia bacterium]|nr:knotted carbamoyltransferase YgeW [Kiritimatiellia bacterium]